jgi:hypothetical protein
MKNTRKPQINVPISQVAWIYLESPFFSQYGDTRFIRAIYFTCISHPTEKKNKQKNHKHMHDCQECKHPPPPPTPPKENKKNRKDKKKQNKKPSVIEKKNLGIYKEPALLLDMAPHMFLWHDT